MANPQPLAGRLGVVAAIEADARPLWEQPRSSRGIQGLAKQRRVVAVCGSAHYPERDASGVDRYRAFDASLSPLYRAPPGLLSPARRLCGATIDGYLREFEADGPVVGFERHPLQLAHHPFLYPLLATAPQRGGRARIVGDAPTGASEHQHLN